MNDIYYIDGYYLDNEQINCINSNCNTLVIAGAGSGKTSTILGKIKYLINIGYKESDILCISLTNYSVNSLDNKIKSLGYNIDCKTFHKLSYDIIKNYYSYSINSNLLKYVIDEYFLSIVRYSYRKYLLKIKYKFIKFDDIICLKEFIKYKEYIETFINLIKNNGYGIDYIYNLYCNSFIKIDYFFILEIYKLYEIELNSTNSIDVNDLIIFANNIVRDRKLVLKYKYIIIDEYQDSSIIRINLIKSIINNNNSNIMCVGDDYQSIYRFTGCDLNIFLNFNNYFSNSNIMYLKNTYRNSKELLYVSNNFIMKNKYQVKKELVSNRSIYKPIKIVYCNNYSLSELIGICDKDYVILGRNNFDINKYVNKYEDISNINYMTIHKSKGLEFNDVVIINLTNGIYGFPSKIVDPSFICKLMPSSLYKYDEERRLFYVALTRARNNVYLYINDSVSLFVKEIIRDYNNYIEYIKK